MHSHCSLLHNVIILTTIYRYYAILFTPIFVQTYKYSSLQPFGHLLSYSWKLYKTLAVLLPGTWPGPPFHLAQLRPLDQKRCPLTASFLLLFCGISKNSRAHTAVPVSKRAAGENDICQGEAALSPGRILKTAFAVFIILGFYYTIPLFTNQSE